MNHLANTHLRQARAFLRAGQPANALPLLDKALVLARDDRGLLVQILEERVVAFGAMGRPEEAAQAQARLARLAPPRVQQNWTPAPPSTQQRKNGLLISAIGVAAILLLVVSLLLGVVLLRGAPRPIVYAVPATMSAALTAQPTTHIVLADAPTTAPTTQALLPLPPAPPPTAAPTVDRETLLKNTVGMVVVIVRYEQSGSGRQVRLDLPVATGTAFAISKDGTMLTNRHVVDADVKEAPPATLQILGMPLMIRHDTYYVVCLGSTPKDRYDATVVHKSDQFDLAVLHIDHPFDLPLKMASKPVRQGDDILACGYPGVVMEALNEAEMNKNRVQTIVRKWRQSGYANPLDDFSPDAFNSTLTKGVVSAPERNVKDITYLQMDAAISPGNSGGPILNMDNDVIGICTWGLRSEVGGMSANYNFGLRMEQLQAEIATFIK